MLFSFSTTQDIQLSTNMNDEFKTYLRDQDVTSDLSVQVLSLGSWPFKQCTSDFELPPEVNIGFKPIQSSTIPLFSYNQLIS
jgi:hypothetical protein